MPSRFICFYDAAQLTLTTLPGAFRAFFSFRGFFAPELAGSAGGACVPTCLTPQQWPPSIALAALTVLSFLLQVLPVAPGAGTQPGTLAVLCRGRSPFSVVLIPRLNPLSFQRRFEGFSKPP